MLLKQDVQKDVSALAPKKLSVTTLKKRSDFLHISQAGRRFSCPFFTVLCLKKEPSANVPAARVGYTVSKKVSKKAVTRNRIKRRLREAAREVFSTESAANHDYVIIAKKQAEEAAFHELTERLQFALKWLHKQAKED